MLAGLVAALAVQRASRVASEPLLPGGPRPQRSVTDWTEKPHVVLWLTDDQGWANAGWNNQHVHTPRMDAMAREGIILNRHYAYAWCAPSRAALMTGRMPHDGFQNSGQMVPQEVDMLSHVMKDAGYSTHHVGVRCRPFEPCNRNCQLTRADPIRRRVA